MVTGVWKHEPPVFLHCGSIESLPGEIIELVAVGKPGQNVEDGERQIPT